MPDMIRRSGSDPKSSAGRAERRHVMVKRMGVVAMVVGLALGIGALPAVAATAAGGAPTVQAKVDVNKAGVDELAGLPGIGEATAKAIVAFRQANGPFRSPEDLMQVKGIGEKKLDAIRGLITMN
jgi:competence protein ComEA